MRTRGLDSIACCGSSGPPDCVRSRPARDGVGSRRLVGDRPVAEARRHRGPRRQKQTGYPGLSPTNLSEPTRPNGPFLGSHACFSAVSGSSYRHPAREKDFDTAKRGEGGCRPWLLVAVDDTGLPTSLPLPTLEGPRCVWFTIPRHRPKLSAARRSRRAMEPVGATARRQLPALSLRQRSGPRTLGARPASCRLLLPAASSPAVTATGVPGHVEASDGRPST